MERRMESTVSFHGGTKEKGGIEADEEKLKLY